MSSNVNNCTNIAREGGRWFWHAIALLGLLASQQSVHAGPPSHYGQDYYRQGASWDDGRLPDPVVGQHPGATSDEQSYQRQIRHLELSEGPYSDALAEPLSALARSYRSAGEYNKALDLYGRALHLVRVNDGLYSERQIPIVRALLDSYREAGDMQALDQRYDYFFRLYGKGEPPFTDLRLRASLEYLRWQREAYRIELDADGKNRLLKMYELNKKLLETAGGETGVSLDWYRLLVFSQLRNLYLLQGAIEPREDLYRNSILSPQISPREQELDHKAQRMESIRRSSTSRGTTLLEELIARTEILGEVSDVASLYLELGDWHQWNDNSRGARLAYTEVLALLGASDPSLVSQWLGQPIELPANGAFWQSRILPEDSREIVLQASYDVSARGRPKNIRVAAATEDDERFESRLRRELSATRFRPRFIGGMAEEVEQLQRSYQLLVE